MINAHDIFRDRFIMVSFLYHEFLFKPDSADRVEEADTYFVDEE